MKGLFIILFTIFSASASAQDAPVTVAKPQYFLQWIKIKDSARAASVFTGTLQVTGGSPASGKVLTSDATGHATWQTSGGGGGGVTSVTASAPLSYTNSTTTPNITVDTGRSAGQIATGGSLNKVRDSLQSNINLKLNISDTAAMLGPYAYSLSVVKYGDTASMLSNLLRKSDTANQTSGYLRKNYAVLYTDSSTMLLPYLRKTDTANMLLPYAHFQAVVKYSDTAAMLSNRLKISDTATMLARGPLLNQFKDSISVVRALVQTKVPYGGTGITTGSTSYTLSAGEMLDKIIMYDPSTIVVSIGTAVNASNIIPLCYINSANYSTFVLNRYSPSGETIYFNGVTSNTIIKIYKL